MSNPSPMTSSTKVLFSFFKTHFIVMHDQVDRILPSDLYTKYVEVDGCKGFGRCFARIQSQQRRQSHAKGAAICVLMRTVA